MNFYEVFLINTSDSNRVPVYMVTNHELKTGKIDKAIDEIQIL